MLDLSTARRALLLAAGAIATLAFAVPAQTATDATTGNRPTPTVVKRALTKTWALDYNNSVDTVTLRFRSLKLLATRKAVPYRDFVEPNKWVTPVAAVFDQKTVRRSHDILSGKDTRDCWIYRVSFTGIFWKGDFGWTYKNRDVTSKRISNSC